MSSLLREALEILDLEDWLSQYTDLKDGGGNERRIGSCPRCGDDRYKLYVNVELKRWLCYVCDWGRGVGDVVELMAEISGRHPTEIRIELAALVVPLPAGEINTQLSSIFTGEQNALEVEDFKEVPVPGDAKFSGLTTGGVYRYALRRGLTDEQIRGLDLRAALKLPTKRSEVMGPWLVFPVRIAGRCVAWQGRRVNFDGDIKYLSSANIHDWLWPLEDAFFRVYRPGTPIVLVEGVFDALGLLRYGIPALCTFGKSINEKQIALLRELGASELILMWDADAYRETFRSVERMIPVFQKLSVVNVAREDGKKTDAGDALKDPQIVPWIASRLKERINVRSQEFYQWRLGWM